MRIIDADALAEDLKNINFAMDLSQIPNIITVEKLIENVVHNVREIIMEHIDNQPTAYDVEKVVAEMKERVEKFDCIKCKHYDDEKYVCNAEKSCRDYTFECLYDIVKRGGVE